jgi:hypothetical protein
MLMARILRDFAIVFTLLLACGSARGQADPAAGRSWMTFTPDRLYLTMFASGYISDQFGVSQQGFQLEQNVTPALGLVGRASGYQLFVGNGFGNPLVLSGGTHESRLNFGRFQGGFDLKPLPSTNLVLLGGGDVGDSDAAVFEADFSSWLLRETAHPVNVAVSTVYNTRNEVSSNEIDLRAVLLNGGNYLITAGAGGAVYAGGFARGAEGEGGPDFGVYLPDWNVGLTTQAGYGTSKQYGVLTIYKQFVWAD